MPITHTSMILINLELKRIYFLSHLWDIILRIAQMALALKQGNIHSMDLLLIIIIVTN